MHHLDITYVEKVGDKFRLPDYLKVRELTLEIVESIAQRVEPGMREVDGLNLIHEVMIEREVKKKWHPSKFRIGEDTTRSFREISNQSIQLKESDIFFIDIGPVINGYEGDFGRTFMLGSDSENRQIILAVESVFKKTQDYFTQNRVSGDQLYQYAKTVAKELGYQLNPQTAGHRLGDFPHALYYRGKLQEIHENKIAHPYLWVLEIQIEHPHKKLGAFYEDILTKKFS